MQECCFFWPLWRSSSTLCVFWQFPQDSRRTFGSRFLFIGARVKIFSGHSCISENGPVLAGAFHSCFFHFDELFGFPRFLRGGSPVRLLRNLWDEQWWCKDAYWGCPQFLLISEVPVTANRRIHNWTIRKNEKQDIDQFRRLNLLTWQQKSGKSISTDAEIRGTQREYSSKPLKNSIIKRILVFKQ